MSYRHDIVFILYQIFKVAKDTKKTFRLQLLELTLDNGYPSLRVSLTTNDEETVF